jgi:hypothetical protein
MAVRSSSIWLQWLRGQGRPHLQAKRPLKLGAFALVMVAKLRGFAPYAAIELVLPGGSVIALLLWLYRRRRNVPSFPTLEILSFL